MKASDKFSALLKVLSREELDTLSQLHPFAFRTYFEKAKQDNGAVTIHAVLNDFNATYATKSAPTKITAAQAAEVLYAAATELLMSPAGISNQFSYDVRATEIFLCKRELLLLDILSYRGLRDNALEELNAIKARLLKVESYDLMIEVCERIVKYQSFYGRPSDIKKARAEKEKFMRLSVALQRTIELYFNNLPTNIPESALQNYKVYYPEILQEIAALQQWAKSKQIDYYRKLVAFMYYDLDQQYNRCAILVVEIKKMLLQNKFLFSKARMHQNYLNGAYCMIKQYQFKKAAELIKQSAAFAGSETNRLIGEIMYSIVMTVSGNGSKNRKELERLYSGITAKTPSFLSIQVSALYVVDLFLAGELGAALKVVERGLSEVQDKEGWYHHLIVLKIMLLITLGEYDRADVEIENFRKKIERKRSLAFNFERLVILKRMLVVLAKASYDFTSCKSTLNRLLKTLEADATLHWSPGSSELIPVDRWLQSSIQNEPFNQAAAVSNYQQFYEARTKGNSMG